MKQTKNKGPSLIFLNFTAKKGKRLKDPFEVKINEQPIFSKVVSCKTSKHEKANKIFCIFMFRLLGDWVSIIFLKLLAKTFPIINPYTLNFSINFFGWVTHGKYNKQHKS